MAVRQSAGHGAGMPESLAKLVCKVYEVPREQRCAALAAAFVYYNEIADGLSDKEGAAFLCAVDDMRDTLEIDEDSS